MSSSQLAAMLLRRAAAWRSWPRASSCRVYRREERLADILDLPWGEKDVDLDAAVEQHSSLVENTIGVAGRLIDQMDDKGTLLTLLERARVPDPARGVRACSCSPAVRSWPRWSPRSPPSMVFGGAAALASPFLADRLPPAPGLVPPAQVRGAVPGRADARSRRRCPPGTRSSAPSRSCARRPRARSPRSSAGWSTRPSSAIRWSTPSSAWRSGSTSVTWTGWSRPSGSSRPSAASSPTCSTRWPTSSGPARRCAARCCVLTAEGRISAYILGALPIFLGVFMQVSNPDYLDPMFEGWGLVWISGSLASIAVGMTMIFRMIKVDV